MPEDESTKFVSQEICQLNHDQVSLKLSEIHKDLVEMNQDIKELHGEIRSDLKDIHAKLMGNGTPGIITRLDRLEQSAIRRDRTLNILLGVSLAALVGMVAKWGEWIIEHRFGH